MTDEGEDHVVHGRAVRMGDLADLVEVESDEVQLALGTGPSVETGLRCDQA